VFEKGRAFQAWPPIGVLSVRLAVSPANEVLAYLPRPRGVQVWNCAAYDTVTAFDYGDPAEPLRPILIRAARNSLFSGRLVVGSDQPIKGLKVGVTDLARTEGGAKLPAAAVRIRCAVPATPAKSWLAPHRFDGLLDAIPAEIPVISVPREEFYNWRRASRPPLAPLDRPVDRKALAPGAVAPLWFTIRVLKDAPPGVYEGTITVSADGLAPTNVPLRVNVCDWTMPDPQDWRLQNFMLYSEDETAEHYGVPRWSDKHFELIGQSLTLAAEVNSREVHVNLSVDFYGQDSNPETLVRWIKQPDGSFKHDFTIFDRYLDVVAKAIGKPRPLRLNCWGTNNRDFWGAGSSGHDSLRGVSVFDPATGKLECMATPTDGTEESLTFWRPVFDEMLKKIRARGWLEATALGYTSSKVDPLPATVDVAHKLWPEGVWSWTAHWPSLYGRWFRGTTPDVVMRIRHIQSHRSLGSGSRPRSNGWGMRPEPHCLGELVQPRRETLAWEIRNSFDDNTPPREYRRFPETLMIDNHDGWVVGLDLFPLKKPSGGYYNLDVSRGTYWSTNRRRGGGGGILSMLYPGPQGVVATERFEMFREGMELTEAILFIEQAIVQEKLGVHLLQRAERVLEDRHKVLKRDLFVGHCMPAEGDAKLLDLAGEVARELKGKK